MGGGMSVDTALTTAFAAAGIGPRCPVLALCSAGVDSMVLLDLLAQGPWPVHVLHVDHGLRAESAREAEVLAARAAALAARRTAPLAVTRLRVAVADRARIWACGLEEAGRRVRYRAALCIARRQGIAHVVTAHHGDDQVETILDHILRGSHDRGAAGMATQRSLAPGISLLRPLLVWRRADILSYARRHKLTWCEDPSNTDLRWRRNRLRHEVIPALEAGAPGFATALLQRAEDLRHRHQLRQRLVEGLWQNAGGGACLELDDILSQEQSVRYGLWADLLRHLTLSCDRQRLHLIDDLASGCCGRSVVLGGWCLRRHRQRLYWHPRDMPPPPLSQRASSDGNWSGYRLTARLLRHGDQQIIDHDPWQAVIAAQAVVGDLWWRPAHPGERWQALGAPGRRGVRRYLADHGEPSWLRDRIVLLADAHGPVWIPGYTIAQRVRISDPQAACWQLRCTPLAPLAQGPGSGLVFCAKSSCSGPKGL